MTYVPPPVPERWGIGKWGQAHWDGDLALGATKGTITLSPKTAGLRVGHGISAGVLSIVLTPRTANLTASIKQRVTTVTGSIVLSGKTANLIKTTRVTLTAATGAIVLSPQTATLKLGRKLTAQPGAIVLSPKTVGLFKTSGATLNAVPGAIVLSPKTATLRLTLRLSAQAGSIVVSGKTVDLVHHGHVDHILEATTGSIVVTGRLAILTAASEPTLPPETVQPGALNFGHRVILIPNRW